MARVSFVIAAVLAAALALHAAVPVSALNCLLMHGVGQDGPGAGLLRPGEMKVQNKNYLRPGVNMPEYWGDAGSRLQAHGCTNVYGYWTESALMAWSDAAIQQEYCAAIVATNADVVFTHSMGGPVIAAALHNQRPGCIDRIGQGATAKTHWYGLQSPLGGSEAADVLKDVCKNDIIAKFAGRCAQNPDGSWAISKAYASLLTANCPAWLKESARTYESGNMCGVLTQNLKAVPDRIGSGLVPKDVKLAAERLGMGAGLEFIRDAVNVAYKLAGKPLHPDWSTNNQPSASGSAVPATGTDGMVGFTSCRTQPVTAYSKNPKSRFYAVEANHGDGRGTFGDDSGTLNFQPIQYMINMVANTAATKKPNGPPTITPRFLQMHANVRTLHAQLQLHAHELAAGLHADVEDDAEDAGEEVAAEDEADAEDDAEDQAEAAEEEADESADF